MSTTTGRPRTLAGRDYIETIDWTVDEIDETLAVAAELKAARKEGRPHRLLPDKTLFMLFLDKSTRTRNAFETGMTQLGGHAIFLDSDKTQVSHGESPKDTAMMLSRYGDGIAIRHDLAPYEGNVWMREIAKWADIPLINLQCDVDHPTQTLADLMTLREHRGENLRGLKVAMTWAYAPSYARPISVPQGLATLLPRFGMDVVLAHPPGFDLMPEVMAKAEAAAKAAGSTITYRRQHGGGVRGRGRRLPEVVGPARRVHRPVEGARRVGRVRRLDLRRARRSRSPSRTSSTCTACRPTGAARSPTPSSTARTRSSGTRPRTACTRRRR